MIEDLKDHIRVVQMGQTDLEVQIKSTKADYKVERKKYEHFLVRDREKLGYANQMLQTRRMVQLSYENENKRVLAKLEEAQAKEQEKLDAVEKEREY